MTAREERIERLRKAAEYKKAHEDEVVKKWVDDTLVNRTKPFRCPEDIPDIPVINNKDLYTVIVYNLIRLGAIPKKNLIKGKKYIGTCRNAEEAVWNGKEFEYERYKFGEWFVDTINHFEDFTEYDIFIPIREKEE